MIARYISRADLLNEPDESDDPVALGQAAWQRLKTAGRTSWKDWKLVGYALMGGRRHAMEVAKANKPSGKRYNEEFHYWMQTRGFDEIHKSDRAKLLQIMEDLDRVEKWLDTKTPAERASWNHPSTVWRVSWCKDRGIDAVDKKEAPVPNPWDLPPSVEFEEDNEELVWQRGLLERARKAIRDIKLNDHWLLPEPPDKGLIAVVDDLIEAATQLRDYLKWANEATQEELAEARGGEQSRPHQDAEPALDGAD